MSVWMVCPSKRPMSEAVQVFEVWQRRGYHVGVFVDGDEDHERMSPCVGGTIDLMQSAEYRGYAAAVNSLAKAVLTMDYTAQWLVAASDDILPDANYEAEHIAAQCNGHFLARGLANAPQDISLGTLRDSGCPGYATAVNELVADILWMPNGGATFGVMQPTGDRSFGDAQGPYIDRVAGSPWLGREFCERINGGRGPLWEEYFHMGCDEELQAVAIQYGIFWQRPDLTHFHQHWGRPRPGERMGQADRMPRFLTRANSAEEWAKYKKLFAERQAAGFPGSEPL